MERVVFVTRTLDAESIHGHKINTSSGLFELGLLGSLSERVDLRVIHLGANCGKLTDIGLFKYKSINYKSVFGPLILAKEICSNNTTAKLNLLTTGYYPIEIFVILMASKVIRCKSFSYVYDTHRQATEKMHFVKKILANAYFQIGFYLVKKTSGLLVINDSFIKKLSIKTPYLKTNIGVISDSIGDKFCENEKCFVSSDDKKIILFAGTINVENGVDLLIGFVRSNMQLDFELHFYGDGDCVPLIQDLARRDSRVKYLGRVSDEVLQRRLRMAGILINLRDPCSITKDYSFPSKLINFMATGTPVVSNRFPGLGKEFDDCIYVFDSYDEKSFLKTMVPLLRGALSRSVGVAARDFVKKNNDWSEISRQVVVFMSSGELVK